MKQEDRFNPDLYLEVRAHLPRKGAARILGKTREVKIPLLIDVYCWLNLTTMSGLDFTEVDQMDPTEYMTWLMLAASDSYYAAKRKRKRLTIDDTQKLVPGLLWTDQQRIFDLIVRSRTVGETVKSYQEAMQGPEEDNQEQVDGEDHPKKKAGNGAPMSS